MTHVVTILVQPRDTENKVIIADFSLKESNHKLESVV